MVQSNDRKIRPLRRLQTPDMAVQTESSGAFDGCHTKDLVKKKPLLGGDSSHLGKHVKALVAGHAVRSQTNRNSLFPHVENRRHTVAEIGIGPWTVHDKSSCFS